MLVIISPSKTMDFDRYFLEVEATEIRFPLESELLCGVLKQYEPSELAQFMAVSDKLAKLNVERFRRWQWPFPQGEGRSAIYAFRGDVYAGFEAESLSADAIAYAQLSVRILSGLYGLLRPLDAIMPYRLEMGRKLVTKDGADLYEFWRDKLTAQLNDDIKAGGFKALVNLASAEYFKAIDQDQVEVPIVSPVFKDFKNGVYKIIGFNAKKARGLMSRFIVDNRLTEMEDLKAFDRGGYHFNNDLSGETELVFTRR
jgi:cytoplasmic iron level regulating protein YaaA (DUF328/UPF0246 family)